MKSVNFKKQKYYISISKIIILLLSFLVINFADSEIYGLLRALLAPSALIAGLLTSGFIPSVVANSTKTQTEKLSFLKTIILFLGSILLIISPFLGLWLSLIVFNYVYCQIIECHYVLYKKSIRALFVNSLPIISLNIFVIILEMFGDDKINEQYIIYNGTYFYIILAALLIFLSWKILLNNALTLVNLKEWWHHHIGLIWSPLSMPIYRFTPVLLLGYHSKFTLITAFIAAYQFFSLSVFTLNRYVQGNLTLVRELSSELIAEQKTIQKLSFIGLLMVYVALHLLSNYGFNPKIVHFVLDTSAVPILFYYFLSLALGPSATYLNQLGGVSVVRKNTMIGVFVFAFVLIQDALVQQNDDLLLTISVAILLGRGTADTLNYASLRKLHKLNLNMLR